MHRTKIDVYDISSPTLVRDAVSPISHQTKDCASYSCRSIVYMLGLWCVCLIRGKVL